MHIKSIKIMDNNRFGKGLTLHGDINVKRTDNPGSILPGGKIGMGIVAAGINSVGKSSICKAIKNYFDIFGPTQFKVEPLEHQVAENQELLSYLPHGQIDPSKHGTNSDFFDHGSFYLDEPKYEVIYVTDEGTHLKHQITTKFTNNETTFTFHQKIWIATKTKKHPKYLFFPEPNGHGAEKEYCDLMVSQNPYIQQLMSFIKTTQIVNSVVFQPDILYKIADYCYHTWKTNHDKFYAYLSNFLKVADPSFQNGDFLKGGKIKFLNINVGEKNVLKAITNLSQGAQKTLALAMKIFVLKTAQTGLLIVDDWESHLNHQLAGRIMTQSYDYHNFQGFITTHAPAIFDNCFRYDLLYEITRDKGAIRAHTFAKKYKLRSDRKVSNFYEANIMTTPEQIEDERNNYEKN